MNNSADFVLKIISLGFILAFMLLDFFFLIVSNRSESLHVNFVYANNTLKSVAVVDYDVSDRVAQQVCQKWWILCRNYQLCKMGLMVCLWINSCIKRWLKSSVNVMLSFIAERFTTATPAWQFPLFENKVIHQLVSSSIKAKILRTKLPRMMNSCNLWTNPRPGGRLWKREIAVLKYSDCYYNFLKLLFLNNQ